MADWNRRFMELATHIAQWSKDKNTRVGCIIVGPHNEIRSTGFNGFPRGVDDRLDERQARPLKYSWTEHAERNAIYNAARAGVSVDRCRMYLPWFPCMDCARAIVQSGIVELIALRPDLHHPKWGKDHKLALELFTEVGLELTWYDEQLPSGLWRSPARVGDE
jgi:dCMP deaminase